MFLKAPVSPETLLRFYGVTRSSYEELFKVLGNMVWTNDVRLKRRFDFHYTGTDIVVADTPGLVNSLEGTLRLVSWLRSGNIEMKLRRVLEPGGAHVLAGILFGDMLKLRRHTQ